MTTAASLGLTAHQFANAEGIIAAAKARNLPETAAVIAVMTALTESGMRVIASANVHASQAYPHDLLAWTDDGLGHDHASMGMFQQQTGYAWADHGFGGAMNQTTMNTPNGWGTPAQLMSAEKSTEKFFAALETHNWQHLTPWLAAQAVQGSAFADGSNYHGQYSKAHKIVTALWVVPPAPVVEDEDDMMVIYVNRKDKAFTGKRGAPVWPGVFLLGGGKYTHLATEADQKAFQKECKTVVVSYQQHLNFGGK